MHNAIRLLSINIMAPALLLSWASPSHADFVPIPLTPESYNQDVVVEKTASPPIVPVTTATMDAGAANQGYTWFEKGFASNHPDIGLPPAGSRIMSETFGDQEYLFGPSYKENNAVVIDSTFTRAGFALPNPSAYAVVSLLVSGGNGGGPLGFTLRHADGTSQAGTVMCHDWVNWGDQAYTAGGKVDVTSYLFSYTPTEPRLHGEKIVVTNSTSPILSVDFSYVSGTGREVVFALSGARLVGDPLEPIQVTGYNADLVVEASSTRPDPLFGYTTATMDDGTHDMGNTWYEQGYYDPAPTTGLPAAGSVITNAFVPDHRYVLAANYTTNNAAVIDRENPEVMLVPQSPAKYAALSFLTSAGYGPVTNQCVVGHADGTSETNLVVSPDWLDTTPAAFWANGRVKIGKRLVDGLNTGYPKLYSVDLRLGNATSPMTNITLRFVGQETFKHAAVLAVSGQPSSPPSQRALLSIRPGTNGNWILSSTIAGKVQSTIQLKGDQTKWADEGAISQAFLITNSPAQKARFYRVVSQ